MRNRFINNLIFLLFLFPNTFAQKNILGKVIDNNNNPIFAANIYLKNNTAIGSISNSKGLFELKFDNISISDTLIISFIGYYPKQVQLNKISFNDSLIVILNEKPNTLEEVVINANLSLTKEFSIKKLDKISIYMSPVSYGDPLKAISFLPYSTNTSENANPELRGSSGDFSRVILNNVPIYAPVRNTQLNGLGNFSILNTELIEEQIVYAGNPPLKYGNSLAGLVEINSTDHLTTKSETKVALSLANLGILRSQKINNNSFFQIFGNYQSSNAYLALNKNSTSQIKDFKTADVGLNFHYNLCKTISLNTYSYYIDEGYNADSYMYNYLGNMSAQKKRNFNVVNLFYKKKKTIFSFNNGTNISKSNYNFGNILSTQEEKQIYTSIDSKFLLSSSLTTQIGISHDYFDESFSNTLPYFFYAVFPQDSTYSFSHKIYNNNLEGYLYNKLIIGNMILGVGFRKNIPIKSQKSYLSFQSSLRYNLNNTNSFLFSAGKYNGYTVPGFFVQSFTQINSTQFSLEYIYHTDNANINLSVYKKEENSPIYYPEIGNFLQTLNKIEGAEASFDYLLDKFQIFGAYTLLNSNLNNGNGWYRAYNDMSYLVKIALSYYNHRFINVSLNYTQHPGLFYSPVLYSEFENTSNQFKPIYGEYNSCQYNIYSTLDLTFNKIIALGNSKITTFFTLSNTFNRLNQEKLMYNNSYSKIIDYWSYQKRLVYFGMQITL